MELLKVRSSEFETVKYIHICYTNRNNFRPSRISFPAEEIPLICGEILKIIEEIAETTKPNIIPSLEFGGHLFRGQPGFWDTAFETPSKIKVRAEKRNSYYNIIILKTKTTAFALWNGPSASFSISEARELVKILNNL